LIPEGRLDARAAPELEGAFATLEARDVTRIVVDLSRSSYISSSCLRLLIVHARKLRRAHGDLKLCSLSKRVESVLRMAGLNAVFAIFPSEEQAVEDFINTPHGRDTALSAQESGSDDAGAARGGEAGGDLDSGGDRSA
jgi:anti-anti-sigma factor